MRDIGQKTTQVIKLGVIAALLLSMVVSVIASSGVLAESVPKLGYQYEDRGLETSVRVSASALGQSDALYQVGSVSEGVFDANPGSGVNNLPEVTGDHSISYLRKFDTSGNFASVYRLGNGFSNTVYINNIAFSSDKSHYYLVGEFTGTVDFGFSEDEVPSATSDSARSSGFIAQYQTSNDQLVALNTIQGQAQSSLYGIAVDPVNGDVSAAGSFGEYDGDDEIDVDPTGAAEIYTAHAGRVGLVVTYASDLTYDAAIVRDTDDVEENINIGIEGVAYNGDGDLYYALTVYADYDLEDTIGVTLDFDDNPESDEIHTFTLQPGSSSSVIVKVDGTDRAYLTGWFFDSNSEYSENGMWISQLAFDSSDNLYYAGSLSGPVNVDPGMGGNEIYTNGAFHGFIGKLNAAGEYQYTFKYNNVTEASSYFGRLAVDSSGNVYALGSIYPLDGAVTVDIDPSGAVSSSLVKDESAFLVKINGAGVLQYGAVAGSQNSPNNTVTSSGLALSVDTSGNVYTGSNIFYTRDLQDPDTCSISSDWRSGVGTAKFTASGASATGWLDFTALPDELVDNCDVDGDGVTDADELAVEQGDANGDGTDDKEQSNVAATVNPVTGKTAAIEITDDQCGLNSVVINTKAQAADSDDYAYPVGLFGFEVSCGENSGYTVTVKQYFYDAPDVDFVVRKAFEGSYQTIDDATISTETINGAQVLVVTYDITDGGALDADGQENGVIVDPAGPAVLASATPDDDATQGTAGTPSTGFGDTSSFSIGIAILVIIGSVTLIVAARYMVGRSRR